MVRCGPKTIRHRSEVRRYAGEVDHRADRYRCAICAFYVKLKPSPSVGSSVIRASSRPCRMAGTARTYRSGWYAAMLMMFVAQDGQVASGWMWTTIRGCDALRYRTSIRSFGAADRGPVPREVQVDSARRRKLLKLLDYDLGCRSVVATRSGLLPSNST